MAQTRSDKLEAAVKAAIRLRRRLVDLGEPVTNLMAPRSAVEQFDKVMADLAGETKKGEFDDV